MLYKISNTLNFLSKLHLDDFHKSSLVINTNVTPYTFFNSSAIILYDQTVSFNSKYLNFLKFISITKICF